MDLSRFIKPEYRVKKIAEVPDSEEGAKEYLRLMAGVILANWQNEDLYQFASKTDINYFPIWLDTIFVYVPNPEEGELILKPQTMVNMIKQTGYLKGDCKASAIFVGSLLKNYQMLGKCQDVYIMQVINPNRKEKHVVAGYRSGTTLHIIDPTTDSNIDFSRVRLMVKL